MELGTGRNAVMAEGKFVAYYRVSTERQGQSGLGLEAQENAVLEYLNGGGWKLVDRFIEVESGKRNDRPELAKALAACRRLGATLVIAKLDRLARNVAFVANLMEAGVDFVACDFPQANRLTIHILAAVAEHEREMISQRTKAALAAAKARGVKLGNPNLTAEARAKGTAAGHAARQRKAAARAADLQPIIVGIRATGATSLRAIAAELDARGIPAPRGGRWTATAVMRVSGERPSYVRTQDGCSSLMAGSPK
jgi:DNA invertase Pin-like site-specific DNA recombinase